MNKNISGKVFYYIGEVIVVIIGIFIAFQLNNFKENIQSVKEETKALKRISADLQTEKFILQDYLTKVKYSRKYLKEIVYDGKRDNLDSILFHLGQTFIHYKMNSEYINLKYSGRLNLISNDTLRYNLVRFYEGYYTIYDELAQRHKSYVSEHLEEYFINEFPSDTTYIIDPKRVKDKLEQEKFRNLIIDQMSFYGALSQTINIEVVDQLNKMVRKEFE
ncbi:MAG: hypothetical protein JW801_19335 [Bacteroidales bacterium]|nr:hypothetical protein [Bacteroidales bacterium]